MRRILGYPALGRAAVRGSSMGRCAAFGLVVPVSSLPWVHVRHQVQHPVALHHTLAGLHGKAASRSSRHFPLGLPPETVSLATKPRRG